ncbi:hypothetical protein OKW29_001939 [Paraburkholderia sp. CI3]
MVGAEPLQPTPTPTASFAHNTHTRTAKICETTGWLVFCLSTPAVQFTMAIRLLKVLVILLISGAGFCPVAAHAYALDGQFDCRASPHAFIGQLINNQYIDPNPMHVEANSVNAFRPAQGSDITAFGFRVYAVLGYEQDDGTFKKGRGNAFAGPLYGAVLSAPSDAVESRVRDAGSNATVRMVIPLLLTAVVCSPS